MENRSLITPIIIDTNSFVEQGQNLIGSPAEKVVPLISNMIGTTLALV